MGEHFGLRPKLKRIMHYIPFNEYKRRWIFTHQSMPLDLCDHDKIKPMNASRSAQIWNENISKKSPTADHFEKGEWPVSDLWDQEMSWQIPWDEDEDLPCAFIAFFPWEENQIVYFCYSKDNLIETSWSMFKKYWKNFLFYDDKPILLGRRRKEVAIFEQNGFLRLGRRP